jgi:hypothetical protein
MLDAYKEWMGKNGSDLREPMVGWINADTAYEGIKAAGPGFDRQSVINATNKITDYTAVSSRRSTGPTSTRPRPRTIRALGRLECFAFVKVKTVRSSSRATRKSRACWPGDTRDWSDPIPSSFS